MVRVVGCGGGSGGYTFKKESMPSRLQPAEASITRWVDANTREHSRMHTDTSSHSDIDIRIHVHNTEPARTSPPEGHSHTLSPPAARLAARAAP